MHESGLTFVKEKAVQRWLRSLAPEVQEEINRLRNALTIHHILDTRWEEICKHYSLYEEYQQALGKSQHEIEIQTPSDQAIKQLDDREYAKTKQYLRDWWCELRPLISELIGYIPVEQDGFISFADVQFLKETWEQEEGSEWGLRTLEQRLAIAQDWYECLKNSLDGVEVPDGVWETFLRQANVFGATCAYSGSHGFLHKILKMRKKNFDYVIIDEVSKVTANDLVIPALSGKKVILVGDHKQLPSMWKEETQEGIQEAMKLYPTFRSFKKTTREFLMGSR